MRSPCLVKVAIVAVITIAGSGYNCNGFSSHYHHHMNNGFSVGGNGLNACRRMGDSSRSCNLVMSMGGIGSTRKMGESIRNNPKKVRSRRRGLLFGVKDVVGGSRQRMMSLRYSLRKYFSTIALAFMLFFSPSPGGVFGGRNVAHASTISTSVPTTVMASTATAKIPGAKAYIRKFLFNDDQYSLFDTAIRESDGQAIDAVPGMTDSTLGQPYSSGFIKEVDRRASGPVSLQILKSVLGLAIVFGMLPLVLIICTQGWKIVTDLGERLTYGKGKSVGKDTYSAYDATEKDEDDLDDDDDDDYDPENP